MLTELERDARFPKPIRIRDVIAKIRERDRGTSPHQELRRRDAAAGGPDDGHALAAHGEAFGARHRSLRVVRLNKANTIAVMRKRVMTFGSLHPISSKW